MLKAALNSTSVTDCMQKSWQELCKFTSSSQHLSIIDLRVVNSHRFNQSGLDTRSWYHGMAVSMECLQAPLHTPSSPDCPRLAPLAQDYTRLSRPKPNRESVRRLTKGKRWNYLWNWRSCRISINCKEEKEVKLQIGGLKCRSTWWQMKDLNSKIIKTSISVKPKLHGKCYLQIESDHFFLCLYWDTLAYLEVPTASLYM